MSPKAEQYNIKENKNNVIIFKVFEEQKIIFHD